MTSDYHLIRRLPAPFSIRDLEQYVTRKQRLRFEQNPARIATNLIIRWRKQGLIKEAATAASIPHYWLAI